MEYSRKTIISAIVVVVLLICGSIAYATNTPSAQANRQLELGNKYLQEGKYQEAILAFQKVIEIEPKNIPARLGLGQAYIATRDYAMAETVLKEVIELDQNNVEAREYLFQAYVKEGNTDLANSILQDLAQLNPNKDVKQYNAELDAAKAISSSKAYYEQGIQQMNDKQYLPAVDSFRKVLQEDTDRYADAQSKITDCKKAFVDITLQKAKDAAGNKDYKTALALLEQILKIEPNNQEALQLKSDYSYALQEEKKSINTINSKQALQIVVNYSGSPNWDVFEGTLDEKFLVNGTSQYTNGHPSCFFVGKGGNVAIYVVDKIDGSLYGSRKEIINGEFIYYLTKLK